MTVRRRNLAFDSALVPAIMKMSLIDPAFSYSCIVMSAAYSTIHKGSAKPDVEFMTVYGRATKTLHEQIARQASGTFSVPTIMAAVNLMMAHGIGFGDLTALTAHWKGIQALVRACGGFHLLSPVAAGLCLWLDYWFTLYTNREPVWTKQVITKPHIVLEDAPSRTCGAYFESTEAEVNFPESLLSVCFNTCRLIELLEDKVKDTSTLARWGYFGYKRDTMCTQNAIVHFEQHGQGTKSECLSLTMNLFLLLTLRMVPWKMPMIILCTQLREAIIRTNLDDYWAEDVDMLTWILFIAQAAGEHWKDKEWALELLRDTLEFRQGKTPNLWPQEWWEMERQNLQQFAWSEIFLDESFQKTSSRLVSWDES